MDPPAHVPSNGAGDGSETLVARTKARSESISSQKSNDSQTAAE
jgi:hypothetical protein